MMTPQEIRDIQFDKSVFGGYDMGAVDEFLADLGADYSALYKENAVLKNKLKLLAETVEEYRSVDEAMRKALVTAQNMANDMVADAQKKANELITNASSIAQSRVSDLANKIAEEETRLAQAKRETSRFADELLSMYKSQAEMIHALLPLAEVSEEEKSLDDTLSLATEQISQSVEEALNGLQNYKASEDEAEQPSMAAEEMVHNIEKQIEEKNVQDLGGKEDNNAKSYSVRDGIEPALSEEDGQIAFGNAAADNHYSHDSATKKFDISELKFGKNYDFDDDEIE